jgi:hypothetical protein
MAPAVLLAQSAPFTYQGRLTDHAQPANGNYDLTFRLTDAQVAGNALGTLTNALVPVTNGLFTVTLDFGAAPFDGSALWLEIGVRTNSSTAAYTILQPRQPLSATPYATFASVAGAIAGGQTNSPVYASLTLAGATNVVISATNDYVVTTPSATNTIIVTGAGLTDANGVYTLQSSSPLVYVNTQGLSFLYLPNDEDYPWQIQTSTGTLLYGTFATDFTDFQQWRAVGPDTSPRPDSVTYGVSLVTNYVTRLMVSGASMPAPSLGNDLYVNATIGNDILAQRGRPDLPFKTVYGALRAATNNDTVVVAPGTYNETPFKMTLPTGLKLLGAGRGVTRIYGHPASTGQANLDLGSSNVLSGFTTDFILSLGGYDSGAPGYGPVTNVVLDSIMATGVADVVYLRLWQGFRANDCTFNSQSDCVVDFQTDPVGTNAVAELYNCSLKTRGLGPFSDHGLVCGGRGQLRMFGGSIEAKNSASSICVWAPSTAPPGGSIELSGVSLRYSTTNTAGRAYAIANQSGGNSRITLKGMLVNAADVVGPVSSEGSLPIANLTGGLTTNLNVLVPGNKTNQLQFINGVLNAIVPQ